MDKQDIQIGTRGTVRYLSGKPIHCIVRQVRVVDGYTYVWCDDFSGDIRVFRADEFTPDKKEGK